MASFHKLDFDPAQLGNGSDQPGLAVASAHSSVKNTCVEEAACVDLYNGNELSQVVPSVAPQ